VTNSDFELLPPQWSLYTSPTPCSFLFTFTSLNTHMRIEPNMITTCSTLAPVVFGNAPKRWKTSPTFWSERWKGKVSRRYVGKNPFYFKKCAYFLFFAFAFRFYQHIPALNLPNLSLFELLSPSISKICGIRVFIQRLLLLRNSRSKTL